MPFPRVQLAAREDVECGTGRNGYVSDDKARVVSRKGIVYRVWEDVEAIVKKEDKKEYDEGKDAKLDGSADLKLRHEHGHMMTDDLT